MGHDNEWTVATLKAYFDALRREDQRALELLGVAVRGQLERLAVEFAELKTAVDQFHSAFLGSQKQGDYDWLRFVNIVVVTGAAGTLLLTWLHHL